MWPSEQGKDFTLAQLINRELSFWTTVKEESMFPACVIVSESHGHEMISAHKLKKYIHNGVQRQTLINQEEVHECCYCHKKQCTMHVEGRKLTGGLQRTPCCGSPIHVGCFWTMIECHFACVRCQSHLKSDTGKVDEYMSNWALAMDEH